MWQNKWESPRLRGFRLPHEGRLRHHPAVPGETEEVRRGHKVELSASFCMGECKDGPCVRIDGVKFHHVDQDRMASLVQEEIVPRANA